MFALFGKEADPFDMGGAMVGKSFLMFQIGEATAMQLFYKWPSSYRFRRRTNKYRQFIQPLEY